jgi:hypothetical protein
LVKDGVGILGVVRVEGGGIASGIGTAIGTLDELVIGASKVK